MFLVSMIIIGLIFILILPVTLVSIMLSSYNVIINSNSFVYKPSLPSPIEKFYINADEANIKILYINPPIDYYAQIAVEVTLIGVNLAGNTYEEFINISWDKTSSPANFTLEIISDDWYNPSLWIKKEINIIITLRKDIVFDIFTTIKEGNFNITIPFGVSVNKLESELINGNIFYNLDQCVLMANMTANINMGNIYLKANNIEYTKDVNWSLKNNLGDIYFELCQYKGMGANISGIVTLNNGNLNLTYSDFSNEVGAFFILPLSDFERSGTIRNIIGFNVTILNPIGYILRSFDYPANFNYNFLFNITGSDIIGIESQ